MFSMTSRKRSRDVADEVEGLHHEKKPRCSAGHEHANRPRSPFVILNNEHFISSAEDASLTSALSEASSSDTDMDMDTSDSHAATSHSPQQSSSSWTLKSSPIRNPRMLLNEQGARVPTPIVSATRSVHSPLKVLMSASPAFSSPLPTNTQNHLAPTMQRVPSPISEDEAHTPTTAAGSQLSLLTVSDMDIDVEPPEPPELAEQVVVRKQRARSGAFTSPREPSKRFTMGYRDDCEKCRMRVPGHMSHFLGT